MIYDLDRTLEALLKREFPPDLVNQVSISFATPDDQFPPAAVSLPAIDLFLYDVRENHDLRSNEFVQEREHELARRWLPPVRVDCSYLITAWPSATTPNPAQDEHRLLDAIMLVLLRYPRLPRELLNGQLGDLDLPLPTAVLQSGHLQSLGEFWQALGGKPKAALNYTVTIAVQPFAAIEEPLVRERATTIRLIKEENR